MDAGKEPPKKVLCRLVMVKRLVICKLNYDGLAAIHRYALFTADS